MIGYQFNPEAKAVGHDGPTMYINQKRATTLAVQMVKEKVIQPKTTFD